MVFLRDVDLAVDFPAARGKAKLPVRYAVGTEMQGAGPPPSANFSYGNAGVMLLNVPYMFKAYPDFISAALGQVRASSVLRRVAAPPHPPTGRHGLGPAVRQVRAWRPGGV